MSLLFDVIADLSEGITVMPVFAADKAEAPLNGLLPGWQLLLQGCMNTDSGGCAGNMRAL